VADMALVMAMVLLGLEVIISAINDYKLSKKGEKNEN
jgi:hypothetical protein